MSRSVWSGARCPAAGLALLDDLPAHAEPDTVRGFQPGWAVRAHLLAETGRVDEAGQAYAKAISLTTDPATRDFLESRLRTLVGMAQ